MNKHMMLDRGLEVQMGLIRGKVFGGPFMMYVPGTRRLVGIKMAAEIDHPHDFSIPTQDYSVPDVKAMQDGIIFAMSHMWIDGDDTYVGCMGGIGRTGLFMGCVVKVMNDYLMAQGHNPLGDPVRYVRKHYKSHAIETTEQQSFVREFDTAPVLAWYEEATKPEEVIREVEVVRVEHVVIERSLKDHVHRLWCSFLDKFL